MADEQNIQHSAAKAAVAQQKPRDDKGRFLSGEELANYRANQQQAQFASERNRMDSLLGRSTSPPVTSQQQPIQPMGQSNFAAIIQANKPGGMASQLSEDDKWAVLLGKKRRGGLL